MLSKRTPTTTRTERAIALFCMFSILAAPACRGGTDSEPGSDELDQPPLGIAGAATDPGNPGIPTEPDPDQFVDPSTPVGTLAGELDVRPNGEARYRIAIDAPTGRGGLQPALALQYASSGGTRDAGKGWSIGGLSSISRCPGRVPEDFHEFEPYFPAGGPAEIFGDSLAPDPYHTLCLDGRLLYPLAEDYKPGQPLELGVVGSPRTRVTADFPAGLNGPGSFVVDLPDGTSKTYGAWDVNDRVFAGGSPNDPWIRRWPLIEHAERSGNTVEYHYTSGFAVTDVGFTTVDHRLSEVEYVGGRISFSYSDEPIPGDQRPQDHRVSYWHGGRNEDSTYLTNVFVRGAADGVRGEYRLEYSRSMATEDLLVDAVSYCDAEGVCMPATRFTYAPWHEKSTGFSPADQGSPLNLLPNEAESLFSADLNGDGLSDIAYVSSTELNVSFARGEGFYTDPASIPIPPNSWTFSADLDGDGSDDLLLIEVDFFIHSSSSNPRYTTRVYEVELGEPGDADFGSLTELTSLGIPSIPGFLNNCNVPGLPDEGEEAATFLCIANVIEDLIAVDLDQHGADEVLACSLAKTVSSGDSAQYLTQRGYWRTLGGLASAGADGEPLVDPESSFHFPANIDCSNGDRSRAYIVMDVNGDGKSEFLVGGDAPPRDPVAVFPFPDSDSSYHVFGFGFSQNTQPPAEGRLPLDVFQRSNQTRFGGGARDLLADVNGDGLQDVLRFEPWVDGAPADSADEGWDDLTHFGQACELEEAELPSFDARLGLFLNRGDGTFARGESVDVFDSWSDLCDRFERAVVADLDGDRRDEVYFPDLGDGFSEVVRFYSGGFEATVGTGPALGVAATGRGPLAFDVSGTVKSGLIRLQEDGSLGLGLGLVLDGHGRAGFVDVLQTVTDGFGAQTELEYGALDDGTTFQAVPCPAGHEALAPLRPLVSVVRRSVDDNSGADVKEIALHRYRGACHDAPNYNFRTFERHEVSRGYEFATSTQITKRTVRVYDDYSTRFQREIFRARPSEVYEYEWFPEAQRYQYGVRSNAYRYGEGFFDREEAPDWLDSVAVGVLSEEQSSFSRQEFPGECDLHPDFSSNADWCTATGAGEFISDTAVVRSNYDSLGMPRLIQRRWGDLCSRETIGYEYIGHTSFRQQTRAESGKVVSTGGGDGALGGVCDVSSPEFSPQRAEIVVSRDPTTWRVQEISAQPDNPAQAVLAELEYSNGQLVSLTQTAPGTGGAEGATSNIRSWTWTYDEDDLYVLTETNPEGHTTETRWHPDLSLPFLVVDPNGVATETTYDGFGRPVNVEVRLGSGGAETMGPPTTRSYVAADAPAAINGQPTPIVVSTIDPSGGEHIVEYSRHQAIAREEWDVSDSLRVFSRTLRIRGLDGHRILRSLPNAVGGEPGAFEEERYDPNGRLLSYASAAADLAPTIYEYQGRNTIVRAPDEGVTTTRASLAGVPVQSVDALGTLSCFYYGAGGALLDVVVNPVINICDGTIPEDGPRRLSTHFEYDERGELTLRDLPGKSPEQLVTNAFGELVTVTDAAGQTRYIRDGLGRVVQREDVGEGIATFDWDSDEDCSWAEGLLRRASSADGIEQVFDYDAFGRVSSRTMTVDDRTFRSSFHYDEHGRVGEIQPPLSGPRLRYEYDGVGRLLSIAAGQTSVWQAQSRDVTGRVSEAVFGNGVHASRTIVEGLLREVHVLAPNATSPYPGSTLSMLEIDSLELEYDAAGQISARSIPHLNLREDFEHDQLGRLRRWTTRRDGVEQDDATQEYWETGAIRSRSGFGTYLYDGMHVSSAGGRSYSHDADGRQETRGEYAFEWTRRARLRSATDGEALSSYAYDAFDTRVRKVEQNQGASTTSYYDEFLELEVAPDGLESHTFYVPGEEGRVAAIQRTSSSEELEFLFLHTNNQGSASVVTDADGLVVERRDFDAFGRVRPVTWAGGDPLFAGDAGLDLGYTGHREQEAHGLIDMRGRHYDPALGRFASADPVLAAPFSSQGHDPFSYVLNRPLHFVDPTGFVPEDQEFEPFYDDVDYLDTIGGDSDLEFGDELVFGSAEVEFESPEAVVGDLDEVSANTSISGGDGTRDSAPGRDGPDYALSDQVQQIQRSLSFQKLGRGGCSGSSCVEAAFERGGGIDRQSEPDPEQVDQHLAYAREENAGRPAAEFVAEVTANLLVFAVLPPAGRTVKLARCGCFTADTPVHTANGVVPIQDVEAGDTVACANLAEDEWAWCVVEEPMVRQHRGGIAVVAFGHQEVEATSEHPFWVTAGRSLSERPSASEITGEPDSPSGGRWVKAEDLQRGDAVSTADGGVSVVTSITVEEADLPVYNLSVADNHNFAVGGEGFLVHNNNCCRNVVYRAVSAITGEVEYVGITNNFARRAATHLRKRGLRIRPLLEGLSRADARAVEQVLIEIHGLMKNGGTLVNKINSIARTNPSYAQQLSRGLELLRGIGYKGL